jgi:hypothetical protein
MSTNENTKKHNPRYHLNKFIESCHWRHLDYVTDSANACYVTAKETLSFLTHITQLHMLPQRSNCVVSHILLRPLPLTLTFGAATEKKLTGIMEKWSL